jgi:signal transduction histidine kinase
MSAHLYASSVVALLLALFNGLLAGYAAASARGDRRRLLFVCGPAGVALFATAWFVMLLEPSSKDPVRGLAAVGALLSVSGFAADALVDLGPGRARRLVLWSLVPAGLVLAGLCAYAWLGLRYPLALVLPQGLALGVVGLLGGVRLVLRRHENAGIRRLSLHVVALVAASLLICGVRTAFELARGAPLGGGLILCLVLIAETVTLSYVLHERVKVTLPVSRAVTQVLFALGIAFSGVAAFRWLGYPVDLVQVAVMVTVALLAATLFLGLSEHLDRWIELLLFPNRARLSGLLAASRAESAALRSRLERAERLAVAGELAASVAHEIKNPLAAVRGYAELLADQTAKLSPEQRARFDKAVRIIREESERIDTRVAELLSLGRAARGTPSGAPLDVSRLLMEAVAVAEGEPDFPTLSPSLDPALRALGNEDELRGVLLNLLKNAAEAMGGARGGRIEVVARREGDRAVVEVRDEGKGLSEVDRERLFQPFYTTKPSGTGLGLAIARSAIEAVGGRLSLSPRTDRPGAVARVELPSPPEGAREGAG